MSEKNVPKESTVAPPCQCACPAGIDVPRYIRRIGEVARLLTDAGVVNFAAFISPYREDRTRARELQPGDFVEVHVDCDLDVCESRDPKGIYKRAREGLIKDFTGVSAPYESPERPEVYLNTSTMSIESCIETLIDALVDRGILGRAVASNRTVRQAAAPRQRFVEKPA